MGVPLGLVEEQTMQQRGKRPASECEGWKAVAAQGPWQDLAQVGAVNFPPEDTYGNCNAGHAGYGSREQGAPLALAGEIDEEDERKELDGCCQGNEHSGQTMTVSLLSPAGTDQQSDE